MRRTPRRSPPTSMTAPPRPAAAPARESARERSRLDVALVARGLAESREKAQALIVAGLVIGGRAADPEVSRAGGSGRRARRADRRGVRRAGAARSWSTPSRRSASRSTGWSAWTPAPRPAASPTCCSDGARERVYAVDVGHGQLDWRLRGDPRVVVMERTNVRTLEALPEVVDLAVADVSFISLRLVLPSIARLARQGAPIVTLVKPQFEAGKGQVPRGGVVRDPAIHRRVLLDLWAWALANGLCAAWPDAVADPGPAGNVEFLLWLDERARRVGRPGRRLRCRRWPRRGGARQRAGAVGIEAPDVARRADPPAVPARDRRGRQSRPRAPRSAARRERAAVGVRPRSDRRPPVPAWR